MGSPAASPVATGPVFESPIHALKFLPPKSTSKRAPPSLDNEDVVAAYRHAQGQGGRSALRFALLTPGQTFSYTFDKPGTYPVFCLPHPFMTQTVVVSEKR